MVTKQINEMIAAYRRLATIPTVTSAAIYNLEGNKKAVLTRWNQRDLARKEKVKFTKQYILASEPSGATKAFSLPPQESSNEVWSLDSPSGKLRAVVKQVQDKKGEKQQLIEVWDGLQVVKRIDIALHDKHGKIYDDDETFGSFQWSNGEDKLLYVAEKKLPKMSGFFDEKKPSEEGNKADETIKGVEHEHRAEWGEQLVGKHAPVLCILDVKAGSITILDSVPDTLSPGQAVWAPGDSGVVFVGWHNMPWRLGLIYCTNRRSQIFCVDLTTGSCTALSEEDRAVRRPRFSPNGSHLVYLDCRSDGPHCQNSRLLMMDWSTKQSEVILDIKSQEPEFYGIYGGLVQRCWCRDSQRLILSTQARSVEKAFVVDTQSKTVTSIQPDFHQGFCKVLDVSDDIVVALCSSPNQPNFLVAGLVPEVGKETEMKWTRLEDSEKVNEVSWQILIHASPAESVSPSQYESILLLPSSKSDAKPPLIVFPHGGPHSAFGADFNLFSTCFCLCGFAVLMVNYRGSTGFGTEGVNCLPGKVGDQDVKDVWTAAGDVVSIGSVDGSRLLAFGGSHGGFLTTHLIGQYPEHFKAACCRNPVINMTTMFGTTDIPDWVLVEGGMTFQHTSQFSTDVMKELWLRSPIRYVDQVVTPLLIMVGKDDLRVPPSQAREYYRALMARKRTVRMVEYADNCHPISGVEAESDAIINILQWFSQYV